ncbi:MAG: 8-amino-7-oxononanoate synthase [Methyloligellaceae bacterium]
MSASESESLYERWLKQRASSGLLRSLLDVVPGPAGRVTIAGRSYVNFSGNDYLGLTGHAEVKTRAAEWAEQYGGGAGASRLVTGNLQPFAAIEAKVAALKGRESALVMGSGFQANAAVLQALLDRTVLGAEPLVFADRLNHASMHFGCQAAGVRQVRYRHCDMDHLASLLQKNAAAGRPRFILTESVFSMDGDVAPMDTIMELARAHDAFVVCDDAHATGILGAGGAGLSGQADLVIGTFSKAMGSYGAYIACAARVRDYLVNRCGGLIYSTALPPAVLGAIDASLDLLPGLEDARAQVAALAAGFRQGAQALGFDTGASSTQIVPLIVGDAEQALALSRSLADTGYWATAIRPPTVPAGTARLRLAFSAAHARDDAEGLLDALASLRRTGVPAAQE